MTHEKFWNVKQSQCCHPYPPPLSRILPAWQNTSQWKQPINDCSQGCQPNASTTQTEKEAWEQCYQRPHRTRQCSKNWDVIWFHHRHSPSTSRKQFVLSDLNTPFKYDKYTTSTSALQNLVLAVQRCTTRSHISDVSLNHLFRVNEKNILSIVLNFSYMLILCGITGGWPCRKKV